MARILLFSVFLLIYVSTWASDGWDLIRANEHKLAREEFAKNLEKDSIALDALKGMIFLSEIEQDKLSFKKYIQTLIDNYPEENHYLLFKDVYSKNPEFIVKQKKFSEGAKMDARLKLALEQKGKRQFELSEKSYNDLFVNYTWNLIGPFKNVSGSGYMIEHPLEKENFTESKTYRNAAGIDLKWVKPQIVNINGKINFDSYLPANYSGGVYFANTFIDVPEQLSVQFRISRSAPMKIWLDDFLVFENKEKINFGWDNEIIQLTLKPGIHRILVKSATSQTKSKKYDFLDFESSGKSSSDIYSYDIGGISDFFSLYNDEKVFSLRITDPNGNIIKSIRPSVSNAYSKTEYDIKRTDQHLINFLKQEIEKDPDNLFNYFALCKAHQNAGSTKNAEEFFVKALRKNSNMVFFKYLAASLYAENGKVEKAYGVLNDINPEKTPIFGLFYEKMLDIDMDNEEQKYLAALDQLKNISPSNYSLIKSYLKYYDKKGLQKEKEKYINEIEEKYPSYKVALDYERTRADNKPNKTETDKEKNRQTKETIHNIKTRFDTYDYSTAISYYKGKGDYKKIISLYDELIRYVPNSTTYRKDKAGFLYSEEKYDLALKELNDVLGIAPYDSKAMEQMGDIYNDRDKKNKENQAKALGYYYMAKKVGRDSYGLDSKIEKIEGKRTLKKLFATKSFNDILNEEEKWKPLYTNEEAVVLMYTRDLILDTTDHVEVYQQMMIKILTEAGAKSWTEYDFSFLGDINALRVIKKNGAEITPDKKGGYVVFKNLEPGDIIQIDGVYKWHQQSEFDNELALVHYVSFNSPTYYKKFEVAVPKGKYLGYKYHKLKDVVAKSSRDNYDFYVWEYANLPKIENEEAVPDNYDLYSSIMISTMPDWSKIVEWYDQITYRKLEMTYEVKEILDSIIKPGMNDDQKVETIYNYLTKEIRYSYVSFLQSGYVPKDPGLTLSSKIGDCKDVATLMISMLNQLGIEAYYTLVKTNAFNHLDILPSMHFDHVVVCYKLNGKTEYLDMTTDFYPYYVLTENDINACALLIKNGEKNIVRLPNDDLDPQKNKVIYDTHVTINTDNTEDITIHATYPGITGGRIREIFSSISATEQKNYLLDMLGKGVFSSLSLVDYKIENIKDISQPLKATYKLKATDFTDNVANIIISRLPYMTAIQVSPAISGTTRSNRLDISALGKTEPTLQKITIHFPKGYKLVELPTNISVNDKYGTYTVSFKKVADGVQIEKYQAFNTRIIDENEFDAFKTFYQNLLRLDKTKIAIQKI